MSPVVWKAAILTLHVATTLKAKYSSHKLAKELNVCCVLFIK